MFFVYMYTSFLTKVPVICLNSCTHSLIIIALFMLIAGIPSAEQR